MSDYPGRARMNVTRKKVLAIDDEVEILDSVKEDLEAAGYEVRVANNGPLGFEIAQEFEPDMIFLDISMPRMNGFQFLDKLGTDPRIGQTPVVMISGYGDTDNIFKAQASRYVRDFVIKPFQAIDLIDMMRRHA